MERVKVGSVRVRGPFRCGEGAYVANEARGDGRAVANHCADLDNEVRFKSDAKSITVFALIGKTHIKHCTLITLHHFMIRRYNWFGSAEPVKDLNSKE
jgi:hypothetical protein